MTAKEIALKINNILGKNINLKAFHIIANYLLLFEAFFSCATLVIFETSKKTKSTTIKSTLPDSNVAQSSNSDKNQVEKTDSNLELNEILLANVSDRIDGMTDCLKEIRDNTKTVVKRIFDSKLTQNENKDQELDKSIEYEGNGENENKGDNTEQSEKKASNSKKKEILNLIKSIIKKWIFIFQKSNKI
ncbi:unnamed protein product [Brachionus calyciflorus]|uniref:Uncharacterized protein n=1 Tax=Brachionus calyciflorus TaxID=104777 RepID=A0A813LYS9_9BILA|nr:unnamed protein product [Brachionus calyciflorus]